jgi:hypothetical protein
VDSEERFEISAKGKYLTIPVGELKSISCGFVSLIRGLLNKFIPTYTVAGSKFNQLVVDINNVSCH